MAALDPHPQPPATRTTAVAFPLPTHPPLAPAPRRGFRRVQVGAGGNDGAAPAHGNMHPAPSQEQGYVVASFDLDHCAQERAAWGVFRDRRPDLYGPLLTLAGSRPPT